MEAGTRLPSRLWKRARVPRCRSCSAITRQRLRLYAYNYRSYAIMNLGTGLRRENLVIRCPLALHIVTLFLIPRNSFKYS